MREQDVRAKATSSLIKPQSGRLTIYTDGGNVSVPLTAGLAQACVLACGLTPADGIDADDDAEASPEARALKCEAYSDKMAREIIIPYLRAARRAAARSGKQGALLRP